MAVVVKNSVTPKWVALVSGTMEQNLRSISCWFKILTHTQVALSIAQVAAERIELPTANEF